MDLGVGANILTIVTGTAAVLTSAYQAYGWLKRKLANRPSNVYVREGNIYLLFSDGRNTQITFSGHDYSPLLGKKYVIFFRTETFHSEYESHNAIKIMCIDINTLKEKVITDQKPFMDGTLSGSYYILRASQPVLSNDERSVIFIVEKYATASQLVQVDIASGKWKELFPAEHFERILSGRYKGKLLVGVSEIKDRGRDVYNKVCNENGKSLLEFEDYNSYMEFRSSAMVKD